MIAAGPGGEEDAAFLDQALRGLVDLLTAPTVPGSPT